MSVTQALRDEHKELLPHIEKLKLAADAVGDVSQHNLWEFLDDAYRFLTGHLIPHAKAEDEALYPVVAKVMGAPEATATMRRDHVEVERLTGELEHIRSQLAVAMPSIVQAKELRRILYGLYALIQVHFAKEEEVYIPLLDERLPAEEAREMFKAMEKAAHDAKGEQTP